MARRELAAPVLISGTAARRLIRVTELERTVDEAWLKDKIFQYPDLLAVEDVEPAFLPLLPLAREMRTDSGPIDVAFINRAGYLTFVETKLWKNPEARREVVAQILDYAKGLSKWDYLTLVEAVRAARATKDQSDPVLSTAFRGNADEDDETDPQTFRQAVEQNLRRGRFLLLIVGDAIRDETAQLVQYLQDVAHLQFTLGLVELGLYRLERGEDTELLVVPRVAARTQEIVRAIVRIDEAGRIQVTTPPQETATAPSFEAFLAKLQGQPDAGDPEKLRQVVAACEKMGLYMDSAPLTGIALRLPDPTDGDVDIRFLFVSRSGRVKLGRIKGQLKRLGLDRRIGIQYAQAIAQWIPGARVNPESDHIEGLARDRTFPLRFLTEAHLDDYLQLVSSTIEEIKKAAATRSENPERGVSSDRAGNGEEPGASE
jgi:hypothetical protein